MRNRPPQDPNQAPSYGYRSYAEMIKQYLIYGRFYSGWQKNQGKYCFRVMYRPAPDGEHRWSYHREPLGYEMVSRNMSTRARNPTDNWVFRAYVDGTAIVRRSAFYSMRSPAVNAINNIISYFYYRESTQDDRNNEGGYNYRVEVLRRKPVNPYHTAPNASDFGRFLENKYNQQPER